MGAQWKETRQDSYTLFHCNLLANYNVSHVIVIQKGTDNTAEDKGKNKLGKKANIRQSP